MNVCFLVQNLDVSECDRCGWYGWVEVVFVGELFQGVTLWVLMVVTKGSVMAGVWVTLC